MRLLIIGYGSIGKRHHRNLRNFNKPFDIKIYDPNLTVSSSDYFSGCLVDLLGKHSFDAAFICSPTHLHVEHIEALAHYRLNLFIEKPLFVEPNQEAKIHDILGSSRQKIMVACNQRFHDGVRLIRKVLGEGEFGRVLFANSEFGHFLPNWRPGVDYTKTYSAQASQGGGILLDDIHQIDYLNFLFGQSSLVSSNLCFSNELAVNVESIATYTLQHNEGPLSFARSDYLRRDKTRCLELICQNGTIRWQSKWKNPEHVLVETVGSARKTREVLLDNSNYDQNIPYVRQLEYFFNCIENDITPMNGVIEATRNLNLAHEIRKNSAKVHDCEMR